MPNLGCIDYEIDSERGVVFLRYLTSPTADEWADALEAVIADPAFRPGFDFYGDRRGVKDVPTAAFVAGAALYLKRRPEIFSGRCWAVVTESPAGYGMARMGQARSESAGVDVGVFTDADAALNWLLARRES